MSNRYKLFIIQLTTANWLNMFFLQCNIDNCKILQDIFTLVALYLYFAECSWELKWVNVNWKKRSLIYLLF